MEEIRLIAKLRERDDKAFEYLVEEQKERIFNLCLNIVFSVEDAEELTMDTLIDSYMKIGQFKGGSKLSTWIYSIAVNKCREFLRYQSRKKRWGLSKSIFEENGSVISLSSGSFLHPGVAAEDKERAEILMKALSQLPEKQRIAFSMHHLQGDNYDTIATSMGKTKSSVESLIHRAKTKLKEVLHNYYYGKI